MAVLEWWTLFMLVPTSHNIIESWERLHKLQEGWFRKNLKHFHCNMTLLYLVPSHDYFVINANVRENQRECISVPSVIGVQQRTQYILLSRWSTNNSTEKKKIFRRFIPVGCTIISIKILHYISQTQQLFIIIMWNVR